MNTVAEFRTGAENLWIPLQQLWEELWVFLPAAFLSFSVVSHVTIALLFGALWWIIPQKLFLYLDNRIYEAYLRACLFVFEYIPANQITFCGDMDQLMQRRERALVLSNHQTAVDWTLIMMLAHRQHRGEFMFRAVVKQSLALAPLFGWYIGQHGYVYIGRFGGFVLESFIQQVSYLNQLDEPYWLLLYPEGTRYTPQKYLTAKSRDSKYEYVLKPRYAGLTHTLDCLRGNLDAVYDVTIAYGQCRTPEYYRSAPTMFQFVSSDSKDRAVEVHVQRYSIQEIPTDEASLKNWLDERFRQKDRMLKSFYNGQALPDRRNIARIQLSEVILPTLFYVFLLILPICCIAVRYIYALSLLFSPILIVWLRIRGYIRFGSV